jgi:hypothetical protein
VGWGRWEGDGERKKGVWFDIWTVVEPHNDTTTITFRYKKTTRLTTSPQTARLPIRRSKNLRYTTKHVRDRTFCPTLTLLIIQSPSQLTNSSKTQAANQKPPDQNNPPPAPPDPKNTPDPPAAKGKGKGKGKGSGNGPGGKDNVIRARFTMMDCTAQKGMFLFLSPL